MLGIAGIEFNLEKVCEQNITIEHHLEREKRQEVNLVQEKNYDYFTRLSDLPKSPTDRF